MSITELKSPICIAAGPWTLPEGVDKSCIGSYTTKSVTPEPREGNTGETFVAVENGYINRMGLPSPGINKWIDQYKSAGIPTFVSLALFSPEEMQRTIKKLKELPDVIGIELNLSCPNTPAAHYDTHDILTKIVRNSDLFVTIKAAPNVRTIRQCSHSLRGIRNSAVVVANSVPVTIFHQNEPFSGGMSGPVIKPIVMNAVKYAVWLSHTPVIACGGISSGQDVAEYMALGAKYVQVGSAHIKEPDCTTRIMSEYLDLDVE